MARGPVDDEWLHPIVRPIRLHEKVFIQDLGRFLRVEQKELKAWGKRHRLLHRQPSHSGNGPWYWFSLAGAVRALIYFRAKQGASYLASIANPYTGMAKSGDERE